MTTTEAQDQVEGGLLFLAKVRKKVCNQAVDPRKSLPDSLDVMSPLNTT